MWLAQDDDRGSEVLLGFWHEAGVFVHEAERQRFGCDLLGRHAVQVHHDVFGVSAPFGSVISRRRRSPARPPSSTTASNWLEYRTSPMSRKSGGGGTLCSASKQSIASARAAATIPPGFRCVLAQRRNASRPGRPSRSCSVCIGTRMSENRRADSKSRASAMERLGCQPARPVLERREQRRVSVKRNDINTVRGKIERHASGSRADVEHRAARRSRQRPPRRQVLAIPAAFEIVP